MEIQEQPREIAWVIADTETTGLTGPACELALREICPDTLETIGQIQSLIDPGPEFPIEPGAQAVHGITDEMVAHEPTMAEFVEHRLCGMFDGRDIVMIGHNVSFDIKRLHALGEITKSVCTLFHARRLITGVENYKLPTLREHFGLPVNTAHRAMDDVETTHRLLREILSLSGRTLRNFVDTQETTVHRFTFGKHKGKLLMQCPRDYLEWMKKQDGCEPNLKASIVKVLKTMPKAA